MNTIMFRHTLLRIKTCCPCCSVRTVWLANLSPPRTSPGHRQKGISPALAVPHRSPGGPRQLRGHHLDRPGHGVQADRARGGEDGGVSETVCRVTSLLFSERENKNLKSDVCERIFIFIFLLMKILQVFLELNQILSFWF